MSAQIKLGVDVYENIVSSIIIVDMISDQNYNYCIPYMTNKTLGMIDTFVVSENVDKPNIIYSVLSNLWRLHLKS